MLRSLWGFWMGLHVNGRSLKSISSRLLTLQPLLDQALQGSDAALNRLLGMLLRSLTNEAKLKIGRAMRKHVAPSDLAQETCMRAAGKIRNFRGTTVAEFWKWLRVIQRNRLRDLVRRAKPDQQPMNVNDFSSNAHAKLIDRGRSPFTSAATREQLHALDAALDRLAASDREIIRLRWMEKLQFPEIADKLTLASEDVARRRYNKAMDSLSMELRSSNVGSSDQ